MFGSTFGDGKIDSNLKLEFGVFVSTIDFWPQIYYSVYFYIQLICSQNQFLSPQNQTHTNCQTVFSYKVLDVFISNFEEFMQIS
jgi:hypothetical protein